MKRFVGAVLLGLLGAGAAAAQAPPPGAPLGPPPAVAGPITAAPVGQAPVDPGSYPAPVPMGIDGGQFFGSADYLLWRLRNASIPSTVQAVPVGLLAVNTTPQFAGAPAGPFVPGSPTVIGLAPFSIRSQASLSNSVNPGEMNGGRFTVGYWFDPNQTFGVEASFFFFGDKNTNFGAVTGSSVNQFLINTGFTQNFFVVSGLPPTQTLVNSFPLVFARQTTSSVLGTNSSSLWSAELNGRSNDLYFGPMRFGWLAGFRYLNFSENLNMASDVRLFLPPGVPVTAAEALHTLSRDLSFDSLDQIRARNQFFGAQVGADIGGTWAGCFLNVRGKIAVGAMDQSVNVLGFTRVTNNDPGTQPPSSTAAGGALSSALDNGNHSRTRISFVPEVNVKLGYNFTSWLRAYVGYDWLYVTNVARPAEQSGSASLNTSVQVAGSTNAVNVSTPQFHFRDSNIWAQGINFGVELNY